ncbi:MAG: tetratricopeptide repeat protein [Planctomycetia bacterium]|nr:tetratricopeptide repeat protein [Planctomycetia bacterium]
MDRTALAICAGLLCPLGVAANLACNAQHASPAATAEATEAPALRPLSLDDAASWKKLDKSSVVRVSGLTEAIESPDSEGAADATQSAELAFAHPNPESQAANPSSEEPFSTDEGDGVGSPSRDEQPPAETESVAQIDASESALEPIPERSDLPWAHVDPRTPEMMAVAARADQRVQRGFQLAGRGAFYSARAEFVAAIQLIAQANDAQQNTRLYTKALTAGLVALRESADFVRQNTANPDVDAARIIAGHKTPILKSARTPELTAMFAAQAYYNYAQEQLAAAAAQDPGSSMALYGLGKIAMLSAGVNKSQQLEHTAQAMSCYQASLMADPNNFRSANELGVLLAENGSLPQARDLLIRSVTISSQPATWQNLAVVHFRLGEEQLAEQARQRALAMQKGRSRLSPPVEWVDPATFAASAAPSDGLVPVPAASPNPAPTQGGQAQPAKMTAKKGIGDWLPKNPWR